MSTHGSTINYVRSFKNPTYKKAMGVLFSFSSLFIEFSTWYSIVGWVLGAFASFKKSFLNFNKDKLAAF